MACAGRPAKALAKAIKVIMNDGDFLMGQIESAGSNWKGHHRQRKHSGTYGCRPIMLDFALFADIMVMT